MSTLCDKLRDKLDDFFYERLPPQELKQLEDHLETCPDCAAMLERQMHTPLAELLAHNLLAAANEIDQPPPVVVSIPSRPLLRPPTPTLHWLNPAADAPCEALPTEIELTDETGALYLLYRRPDGDYHLHCLERPVPQLGPAEGTGPELVVRFDEAGLARISAEAVERVWKHIAQGLRLRSPA